MRTAMADMRPKAKATKGTIVALRTVKWCENRREGTWDKARRTVIVVPIDPAHARRLLCGLDEDVGDLDLAEERGDLGLAGVGDEDSGNGGGEDPDGVEQDEEPREARALGGERAALEDAADEREEGGEREQAAADREDDAGRHDV